MKIIINQKKISLTDSYEIFIDKEVFFAKSEALKKSAKIDLLNSDHSVLIKIAKQNFGLRANYYIQDFRNEKLYSFEDINNIKLLFKCEINNDLYQLYGHNGNKYSIFKNQKQVGFWEKNSLIFGEQDSYEIILNSDEDPLIISAFCLCIDNAKNNFQNELSLFNFDIGFKGNLLKRFDEDWEPN